MLSVLITQKHMAILIGNIDLKLGKIFYLCKWKADDMLIFFIRHDFHNTVLMSRQLSWRPSINIGMPQTKEFVMTCQKNIHIYIQKTE